MADIRKVGLLTLRADRVLLCRKRGQSTLILPGGKREPGESALDTLRRELGEELGAVTLLDPHPLGIYTDQAAAEPGLAARTIEIELYGGRLRGKPRAHAEIGTLYWFGADDDWEVLAPSLARQIFPDLIRRGVLPWPSGVVQKEQASDVHSENT